VPGVRGPSPRRPGLHVCATTLERELGIEPSPETRAVYEPLIAAAPVGAGAPASAAAAAARTKAPETSPLVGRAGELARPTGTWRAAAGGRAQLVLVTGEAGVGKTRLVEELRGHAGAAAVEARAYPAEGTLAYGVVMAWLRSQPVAARLPRLEQPHLTELVRLLPELAGREPPPAPLPEAELRRRLFDAIARAALGGGLAAAADRRRRAVGRSAVAAPDPLLPDARGAVGAADW
jgi:hypothetical protein